MNATDRLRFGGEEAGISELADARYVVVPVPMESTVSYGSGTAAGPAAILRASAELEFFDEETFTPYWSPGQVHTVAALELPSAPERAVAHIDDSLRPIVEAGKVPITLGGEHTVTVGVARAVAAAYPKLGVLVVDAHLDLRDAYGGTPYSHACISRRLIEEHRVPMAWCGIRSFSAAEAAYVKENQLEPSYAHSMDCNGDWIAQAVAQLPEHVYLSLDIDGLDPAVAPGTGTPEPGGLSYRDVVALIRYLCAERTIVAADLVEVAPIEGQQVTEFTAARLIAKLIGSIEAKSQQQR